MGMEFLDNQSENQYLNTIDRENRFQNSKYNEHRYAKLSSRLARNILVNPWKLQVIKFGNLLRILKNFNYKSVTTV